MSNFGITYHFLLPIYTYPFQMYIWCVSVLWPNLLIGLKLIGPNLFYRNCNSGAIASSFLAVT